MKLNSVHFNIYLYELIDDYGYKNKKKISLNVYQPSNSLLTGFTGERFVNIKSEELYIVYITIITLLPASAGGLIVYKCNEFIIKKGILIYL
jgi:hypothetical protein